MATWHNRRGHKSYNHNIKGTEGNDRLNNPSNHDKVTIQALGGDDTVDNSGGITHIYAGTGNDIVNSNGSYVRIYGEDGNDSISNFGNSYGEIRAGNGNDSITFNKGADAQIHGDAGDDYISNLGYRSKIYGGAGNDTIINRDPGPNQPSYVVNGYANFMDGGDGNDYIRNEALKNLHSATIVGFRSGSRFPVMEVRKYYATINGGAGNDTIENRGSDVTIEGGTGDDLISLASDTKNNLIQYKSGDGNDTIIGFNDTSTLKIGDGTGTYSTIKSGSDIIVLVGEDKITLQGAASLSKVNISGQFIQTNFDNSQNNTALVANDLDNTIENSGSNVTIQAEAGNDSINNGGSNVSINGGAGNDTIENNGSSVTIDGGNGNDSITNSGERISINSGGDDDVVSNIASNVTIQAQDGNDSITNEGASVSINGGDDNDTVKNSGSNVTIDGGAGNDLISLAASAKNNVIVYTNGDGNDVIQGFNSTSTLEISGDYSTEKSGNDIVVTVRDEKITLQGAAALSNVNIVETPVNVNNSLGNKLLSGGNLNDTIFNSGQNVTIDALGSNDSIKNDGKNVSINGGAGRDSINSAGDNVTIDGGADNDIIYNSRIGSGLTIDGGDGSDTISNFSRYSSINGGAGDDWIQSGAKYVTIDGGDGKDTIQNYTRLTTINGGDGDDSIENEAQEVSIDGGAGNDFIRSYYDRYVTITGGIGDDTIMSSGYNALFNYNAGDGNDLIRGFKSNFTLSIADNFSTEKSGNDIIVTVGEGKITLERAASLQTVNIVQNLISINNTDDNKKLTGGNLNDTIFNRGQNVTIQAQGGDDYIWNIGRNATINGGAGDDAINNLASNVTINGGAGDDAINNLASNVIINGGDGNDTIPNGSENVTIIGGSGDDSISLASVAKNDLIQYNAGDGNDTIHGFNETSTLEISGALHSTEKSGNDIIVTVGEGKITLEGAASLSSANIINGTYAIFTVKDSKVTAAIPQSVEGDAYQFNAELNLLTLNDNLKEYPVAVRNEDDSSVKVSGSFGSAELSGTGTLEYQVDGAKNNLTLTSKTYGDKITFREDAAFTYGEIQVDLLNGNVLSTKGEKEISFDNNSSASVTAPEGAKININAGTFTINNLSINSLTNGAGTITVTADGLSFEGYGVQFVDLEVAPESFFSKLAPMTVNYNSADKSYTIKNSAQVKTLSDDFTKLTLALGDDTQANFKVNDKEFLVSSTADNINVVEANGNTFKIQSKEIDAEKIGRVILGEQITFSGTEINFDGVKTNYAQNKPAIYSLDGKEISISDTATLSTGEETKTFKCEAGSYVVNGKSFETSADLTFTADTNEIKIPLNDARTEIYFDGVKINGVAGGGEVVFDLANDKISVPDSATLNITSSEEIKLNLAAGSFTIDGKTIITDNALEITADKDNIKVPLNENSFTINDARIAGTGTVTIDNTDEYFFSIRLPDGALVENVSDNTFELNGKDSFAYFGDTNKKVQMTENGTAYIGYDKENSITVGLNALLFEQAEIQGNDAWTVETSGTGGIDKITGITSGATISASTEYVDAGDVRFEVETDGAGDFTICGEKFTATDKNTYVVYGNSNDEIKVAPLAEEYSDDDSEPAGKIYQFDAAGDYTINGITFHAEENSKVQTITRGVEFDLSTGAFQYDSMTLDGNGSAQIYRYNANLISLTDGAKISGDESKYYNRKFEFEGTIELGDKKFESNSSTRCILLNLSDTVEGTAYTLNGFIVGDEYVEIQNDCYESVKIVDNKITAVEGVKASAEIYGNGLANASVTAAESGEFAISGKIYNISDDSDGVTFVMNSHSGVAEINGLEGSVEGNFENGISINGKAVRLTGASSVKVTSDGENITEISNVAGDLVTADDKTYRKNVRVYELGGAEKLTTSADGTIIFSGNKFETSAGKTFNLDDSGNISGLERAQDENSFESFSESDEEDFSTIDLSTTDEFEEVFGDFSEGLTVNGVFVKVTDSTNFVVKDDEENVYIETTAADTFTINGKTFETYADKTIFKLDADGNVCEIVTDSFYPDEEVYLIEGDFNDEIIFNGKKFCVTGTNDASIFIGEETLIGIELARNSVEVVENGGATEIALSGEGEITIGDKTFGTAEDFGGFLQINSAGNVYSSDYFVGTLSGKLGGLELEGVTIESEDSFSVTSDGEKISAIENLQNGSFTCGELDGMTINGAEIFAANSEEIKATVIDGELKISELANSANVSNSDGKVNFVTKESGEFFIGEDNFKVTGDNSVTFAADEEGKVKEISDLDENASLQTASGGEFVVNGTTLTAKANSIFVGSEDSAKLDIAGEILNKLIEENSDEIIFVDGKENITLKGGEVAVVEDTAGKVNIKASKGKDTIYTAGENVDIDLKSGGATEIFAAEGRVTVENYNEQNGAAFLTENENIAEAVKENSIAFDNGRLTVNSAKVTFAEDADSKVINFFDADGDLQKVGFTKGAALNLSTRRESFVLKGDTDSTLKSGGGSDTIYGGAGNEIDAGAGRNQIYLAENGESTIILSGGKNTVENFNATFDGGDKISVDAKNFDFNFDGETLTVKSGNGRAFLENISSEDGTARILTIEDGAEIKTAIAQKDSIIAVGEESADIYFGKKSGVDFSSYDETLTLDLTKNFYGINKVTVGGGLNTLIGSSANETLTGNGEGTTEFIFREGGGRDVIQNFNFDEDKINVGSDAVTNVVLNSAGNVRLQLNGGEDWLTIEDAQGKNFRINDFVAVVDKNISFDDEANYFVASARKASVTVEDEAEIWLDNSHGKIFVGDIRILDATNSDGRNTLAGNNLDNTISAGKGDASLWGGNGDDLLIGGEGQNLFFYTNGNDTIQGANDGDAVILSIATLDQISGTSITANGATINFKDGGSLQINSAADITYQLADGSKYSANHEQAVWLSK